MFSSKATDAPNPVVRETKLTAYAGWIVRQYKDGQYDAAHAVYPAVSPGFDSFQGAVNWIHRGYGKGQ